MVFYKYIFIAAFIVYLFINYEDHTKIIVPQESIKV